MNCSANFQDAGVLFCGKAKITILCLQKVNSRTLSRLPYTPVLFLLNYSGIFKLNISVVLLFVSPSRKSFDSIFFPTSGHNFSLICKEMSHMNLHFMEYCTAKLARKTQHALQELQRYTQSQRMGSTSCFSHTPSLFTIRKSSFSFPASA